MSGGIGGCLGRLKLTGVVGVSGGIGWLAGSVGTQGPAGV